MKKKRVLALLLTTVMGLGLLTGCGGSGSSSESADSKDAEEGKTLSMMCIGTTADAYMEGYQSIIDSFNENNEFGVTVDAEFVSNSDYKTKLTTLMASDSEPDIIFTWELGYLQTFVDGGKIVDLTPYLEEDTAWKDSFNDGMLDQLTYDGKVYGIPTQECVGTMYYNKAIFEENGVAVPTTYEEYRQVCDTLVANGVTPVALASTPDDAWLVSQYIQQLANGIGGYEYFESLKDGTGKWNDDTMVQAAKLFQEEVEAGYYEDGFTGVSGTEAEALFQSGQTAMYYNGSWETSNLDNSEYCEVSEDVSCFTMPAVDAENAYISMGSVDSSYAVSTNCKNVDAAVGLLKYWTNAENASMLLYDYGRMPSTKVELDQSKLSSLCIDVIARFEEQKSLTPWFDRVDTNIGNEFNNCGVSISNGEDPQGIYDGLQEYAQSQS